MKSIKKLVLVLAVATATIFSSCSKSDPTPAATITSTALDGFSWTENGGTTVKTATAFYVTSQNNLYANNAAGVTIFEITTKNTITGTYIIGDNFSVIQYTGVSPLYNPPTGKIIITSNTGGKMSGTFEGSGTSSGCPLTSIKGTFNNITVQP